MLRERKIKSINTSHSCKSGNLMRFPVKRGMTETGRSMVEMLGVLSIIGVISAAGLYGYKTAMNRVKANELLNEASERAEVVAIQLAVGKQIPNADNPDNNLISEFTDPERHIFKVSKNPNNDKQFNIQISGVSKEVCEQLKTMLGGVLRAISECPLEGVGTINLSFNNDMSQTPYASDCQSPFEWCEALNKCQEEGAECTSSGANCRSYLGTDIANSTTYNGGYAGKADDDTTDCRCPTGDKWDDLNKECVLVTDTTPCSRYDIAECGYGWYCEFENKTCNSSTLSGTGKCTQISDDEKKGGFWVGPRLTDWMSANSWCIGKGRTGLITGDTLYAVYNCEKEDSEGSIGGGDCNWDKLEEDGFLNNKDGGYFYWIADSYTAYCDKWLLDLTPLDLDGFGIYAPSAPFDIDGRHPVCN